MPPITLGRILAFLVLVASFVLLLVSRMDLTEAVLFMALALALLVP